MIRKSGYRFSDKIMLKTKRSMIRKSGYRFSEKIMLKGISRSEMTLRQKRHLAHVDQGGRGNGRLA
jgi:hypothetical protein